jgi:hypothetical protein
MGTDTYGICLFLYIHTDFFIFGAGISGVIALLCTMLMYLTIGRRFDRMLKGKILYSPKIAAFFELSECAVFHRSYRTSSYAGYIVFNYMARFKRLEKLKQEGKLGKWNQKRYQVLCNWYDKFDGLDFRSYASKFDIFIIKIFLGSGILMFAISPIFNLISHSFCGFYDKL